jgi:hypothetical protein
MYLTAKQQAELEQTIRDALKRFLAHSPHMRRMPGYMWINVPRRGAVYVEMGGYPVFGPYSAPALPAAFILDLDSYLEDRSIPDGQVVAAELPKATSWVDLISGTKFSRSR